MYNDKSVDLVRSQLCCVIIRVCRLGYDKKSYEGSNSVRMRHENSGASTVVEN